MCHSREIWLVAPVLVIPVCEALKVPFVMLIEPPALFVMAPPPLPDPVACTVPPELIVIEPPALLIVPVLPDSVRVPSTVMVPPLLLVIPLPPVTLELRISLAAIVIAAELVMPLLADMLPPVTAIRALLRWLPRRSACRSR